MKRKKRTKNNHGKGKKLINKFSDVKSSKKGKL